MIKRINLEEIKKITSAAENEYDKGVLGKACAEIDKLISDKAENGKRSATYRLSSDQERVGVELTEEYKEFNAKIGRNEGDHSDPRDCGSYVYLTFSW